MAKEVVELVQEELFCPGQSGIARFFREVRPPSCACINPFLCIVGSHATADLHVS